MPPQVPLAAFLEAYKPLNHSSLVSPVVKGHVPTPPGVVDLMVTKLFERAAPKPSSVVLDPGCGDGPFIEGVLRYCENKKIQAPKIIGIELDARHLSRARRRFAHAPNVELLERDYLGGAAGPADYVIGNPPYVPITELDVDEKTRYRGEFDTAVGRFDLYLLFFEQSLRNLKPGGRLCFITPEKFQYVGAAATLRKMLAALTIRELHHLDEATFPGLVTYPSITTLTKRPSRNSNTRIVFRNGGRVDVALPLDGRSWSGTFHGHDTTTGQSRSLEDLAVRISCGVATGSDQVFVLPRARLPAGLGRFAYPTIAGRQLGQSGDEITTQDVMLVPYGLDGKLISESRLGDLRTYLARPDIMRALRARTCVSTGKKSWFAFHDNVPFDAMLQPKILCKDIAQNPRFWADADGRIIPRHSVYYIVPRPGVNLDALLEYLNGDVARAWLQANCQRAANGYLRQQSNVLKRLPVPEFALSSPGAENNLKRATQFTPRPSDAAVERKLEAIIQSGRYRGT